jgi:hypothetical protein
VTVVGKPSAKSGGAIRAMAQFEPVDRPTSARRGPGGGRDAPTIFEAGFSRFPPEPRCRRAAHCRSRCVR